MLDLLPNDLLYYIAYQINDLSIADKFRQLSSTLYYLVENVKFNNLVLYIICDYYIPKYYENFNVVVNLHGMYHIDLSKVYGINFSYVDNRLLKKYTNLKHLDLSFTSISDINVLRNYNNLTTLYLSGTYIKDCSVLQYCTKLKILYLACTIITDISAISYCTMLEELNLSNTNIVDYTPLSYCTKLKLLIIGGINITSNYIEVINFIKQNYGTKVVSYKR